MKKIICGVCALMIVIGLSACGSESNPGSKYIDNGYQFNEWISPDGVHYWYREYSRGYSGYSYLAPRYDHDGNLVID